MAALRMNAIILLLTLLGFLITNYRVEVSSASIGLERKVYWEYIHAYPECLSSKDTQSIEPCGRPVTFNSTRNMRRTGAYYKHKVEVTYLINKFSEHLLRDSSRMRVCLILENQSDAMRSGARIYRQENHKMFGMLEWYLDLLEWYVNACCQTTEEPDT